MRRVGADTIVIVGGGGPPSGGGARQLAAGAGATVIAADSGLEAALERGLDVAAVVGDMDSVDPAALAAAADAGIRLERHPEAKDATDLDLALEAALARRPRRVVVVTGTGDRLDHTLSLAQLLASPRTAGVDVEAWIGDAHLSVIRDLMVLRGEPGDLVSLVPLHGPALGVVTDGLLYPLRDEDLAVGSTRGVSNELTTPEASVRLRSGVLVAVQPGMAGTHWRRVTEGRP
ncbi:MAG TPA: thiamine diphosphokinase [Acidimicrobiales bacterium]|nr:thiamine diphosphokinase [Acidimicrobiales bacterium]